MISVFDDDNNDLPSTRSPGRSGRRRVIVRVVTAQTRHDGERMAKTGPCQNTYYVVGWAILRQCVPTDLMSSFGRLLPSSLAAFFLRRDCSLQCFVREENGD
jgi:hypothetical protein